MRKMKLFTNARYRKFWKRGALAVVALLLVVVGFTAWVFVSGNKPMIDGEKLADGRVTLIVDGFTAAYMVEVAGGVLLVDSGADPEATAIRNSLTRMGRKPEDVRAILLTHGHEDHIAGAAAFSNASVYALDAEVDLIEGKRVPDNLIGRFSSPSPTGIEVDAELSDNEVFEIGGARIEVFALPGHTRGSAAYLIDRVLFMGDSAGAGDDDTLHAAPPIFSRDRAENRRSLHSLADRIVNRGSEIDAMVFGHQGPLIGIESLIDWHRNHP